MTDETALARFTQAREALQKAKTIDEVKVVRDTAERLRLYLKQSKESLEMQNDAAEIGLRAERRAGEMLKEGKESGQRDAGRGGNRKSPGHDVSVNRPPTLKEIGVSEKQSSRWQAIASIPEAEFENALWQAKTAGQELTRSMMLNIASRKPKASVHIAKTDTVPDRAGCRDEDPRAMFLNLGAKLAEDDSEWLRKACEMLMEAAKSKPTKKWEDAAILRGYEAINDLKRIRRDDPQRKRGFQIVTDWIRTNQ